MNNKQPDIGIRFQIGRNVGWHSAANTGGAKAVTQAIAEKIVNDIAGSAYIDIHKAGANLKKEVEDSYTLGVQHAARNMIGRASPRITAGAPSPMDSEGKPTGHYPMSSRHDGLDVDIKGTFVASWKALSLRTIREQHEIRGTKDSGKYFQRTGHLRSYLLRFARRIVQNTGSIQVRILDQEKYIDLRPDQRTVRLAKLRVVLMPKVYPGHLPGIKHGDPAAFSSDMRFERAMGLSEEAVEKLRGARIPGAGDMYHRPLLQPVFTYWSLFRIPKIIRENLQNGLGRRG